MVELKAEKILLLRWCVWFFLGNVILFWLIGLRYLSMVAWLDTPYLNAHYKIALTAFLAFSYLGQLAFVALLPCLIMLPLIFIFSSSMRPVIYTLSILAASILVLWLTVDTIIYSLYRFHFFGVVLNMTFNGLAGNVFGLSTIEMLLIVGFILALLVCEGFYAQWLWRRLNNKAFLKGWLKWIAIFISFCLYVSYSMIFFSSSYTVNRIFIDGARFLPLYYEMLGAILPVKHGTIAISRINESAPIQPSKAERPLAYPLVSLHCLPPEQPMNIVIIAIDAWRFDMLNEQVTPNLYQFATQEWVFSNHASGGNSTGPGIFSLFYSIPATYWTAMEAQHRGPIFVEELLKQNYRMGIFASADLTTPPFSHTVFQGIKNLDYNKQAGETPRARDRIVTEKFKKFVTVQDGAKQPFFSFLFYDAAHSYCAPKMTAGPFKPIIEECVRFTLTNQKNPGAYFNRYKNNLYFIDQQIKEVLDTLRANHLLQNTVVLITGDHGEEFDDNHLGYFGHASNFTRYQIQTPLIVHFPHEQPKVFSHRTSHFDIAPTLLSQLMGCDTSPSAYSVGSHLLNKKARPYLVISSYIDFGIIEPDRITTIFPTGYFHIDQLNGQNIPDANLNMAIVQEVFQEIRQFYKA